MIKQLSSSFAVATILFTINMPTAMAAKAEAPVCPGALIDGKKRKNQLMTATLGKKVQAAFDAYSADDIDGGIAILLDASAKDPFDIASKDRFLAQFYAQKGKFDESIKLLKSAVDANILTERDHGDTLRLLADVQIQEQFYKESIENYYKWMTFTCKEESDVWTRIGQAHYALKQLDKMIEPADNAIRVSEEPDQNPYILKVTSYYERKKYKESIDVLETLVKTFPEEERWWTQLGMFYLLVEDYKTSLQTLELAYTQGYLTKEAQIKTLIQLYSSNDMPFKAARLYEKHMKDGSLEKNISNLEALANAWHSALHIDDAAKVYGEVAKLTNEAKHYQKQGLLYVQDEQFTKGIASLNKAIELGVTKPGKLYMSIAESHFYLGQYKSANTAIKKAITYPETRKYARGWKSFIEDTARRKGVSI